MELKSTYHIFRTMTVSLILLLSTTANLPAVAQSPLFSRIENLVVGKELQWNLEKWRVSRSNKFAIYNWKSGKRFVYAVVYLLEAPEETAKEFKNYGAVAEADGLGMKMLNSSVTGLGDENYLFEDKLNGKTKGVVFRKHRVLVRVSASSLDVAKQFASYIADVIPAA